MKKLLLFFLMTISLVQSQTPAAGPTTPPVRNSWDVLSQYGSAYTNQSGVYFDSFGGSNIVGDVTLGDLSVVKKYVAHSYSGIAPNGVNNLNVSGMTHLHLEVWSPDFVSFKIKLEGTNGSNRELEVPFAKTQGSWNSYDLDLSTYANGAGGVTLANLKWIVPVTFGPNNTTLYITNVYFYRPATTQPPTLGTFTVASQLVGSPNFTLTPPTTNSVGAFSYTSSNTNVAQIVNGNQVQIIGVGTTTITANQAAVAPLGAGSAVATFTVSYPAPSASPTPPAREPANVISMFTGSPSVYADPSGFTMIRSSWTGATTMTPTPNGFNTCLQVDNFGFLGYVTSAEPVRFSVVGMSKLHVDIYLNAPLSNMFIFLLSNGDQLYQTGALVAGWNSLDINLSAYPSANLASIYGFKFEQNVGAPIQMYLDNIYFYIDASQPLLTNFSVPTQQVGSPDFTINPPTSNSTGAFTYTSSNTNVAQVVNGNQIQVIGGGTTTITANQAAAAPFVAGEITTSFVVTYPAPTASPIPPARSASSVVSMFTGSPSVYANPVGYNMVRSDWTAATTLTSISNGTNTCLQVDNFGYLGYVTSAEPVRFSVVGMSKLHVDIYLNNPLSNMLLFLLSNGDQLYQTGPLVAGWNSLDINLSNFPAANLASIYGFKFEQNVGAPIQMYLDNIYFYANESEPTITNFSVATQAVGAPNFTITPPTSNSTGAFAYTSSNTNVAQIVNGNQIQIIGGGTSTITANQAAAAPFDAGSVQATFVVTFGAPTASPIPPTRNPLKVVSMYTGTPAVYANAINMVRSSWTGATTMTTVANGTNTALKVDNLGFIGLVNQGDVNFSAAGMTNLHMDVYLNEPLNTNPALSRLFIFLLSNGDQFHEEANLVAGWNSLNINLSQYPNANLSDIYGLKLEQNTSSPAQIYLDNIYFSNDTFYSDADGDGYGNPAAPVVGQPIGSVSDATDCDDTQASVYPNAPEVGYDGLDNNCNGTIDEGFTALTTQLTTVSCNTTLSTIGTTIYATPKSGVSGYRFEVTNLSTNAVQIKDKPLQFFRLTELASYEYATSYSIKVMLKVGDNWLGYYGAPCVVSTAGFGSLTQSTLGVVSPICGSVIPTNTTIYTTPLSGATGYRFRVKTASQPAYILDKTLQFFAFNSLLTYVNGAAYTVEVAVKTTGDYTPYGPVCNFTTVVPSIAATTCNSTIAATGVVYAMPLPNVSSYIFTVTNTTTNVTYPDIVRPLQFFLVSLIPGYSVSNQYDIKVAVVTKGQTSAAGLACSINPTPGARQTSTSSNFDFKAVGSPNPFETSFVLDISTFATDVMSIQVYDMIGTRLESRLVQTSDLKTMEFGNDYATGVYNIVVSQGETTKSIRMIKR